MRQQWELLDREFSVSDNVEQLIKINNKIKELEVEKAALTAAIISDLGHNKNGESTYSVGTMRVTCRTPQILSLDKKAYLSGDVYLDPAFDPIETSTTYKVNRAAYEDYLSKAPQTARIALDALIESKPGKPSVVVRM